MSTKRLAAFAALALFVGAAFAQKPKIAVYVSEYGGYSSEVKSALRTATINTLVRSGRYEVVERSNVIEEELIKQASGDVDDDQLVAFGRQSGAQYVCVSDMLSPFGTRYVERTKHDKDGNAYTVRDPYVDFQVSARIIDVETAEVVALGVKTLSNIQSGVSLSTAIVSAVEEMLKNDNTGKISGGVPQMAVYVQGHRANHASGQTMYTYVLNALFTRSMYNGDFKVVERADAFTRQIDREQIKQHSGDVNDSEISRMGKQYGIKQILVASVDVAMNTYNISARMINVETASVTDASKLYHYSPERPMEEYRVKAVSMVEDMIKRKVTAAEVAEMRAEINAIKEAERTGWRGSGSYGGGASLMLNNIDTLLTGGGQLSLNLEYLKSNISFIRFGFHCDIGYAGVKGGADDIEKRVKEEYDNSHYGSIPLDSVDLWSGFFKLGAFVRLYPVDIFYLSGGVGLGWYGANIDKNETYNLDRIDLTPRLPSPALIFSLGGGFIIPFVFKTPEVGGILIEAQYNIIPIEGGGGAGFLSINAGFHFGRGFLINPPELKKKEVI